MDGWGHGGGRGKKTFMDDPQCWFCHLQFLTLEINSLLAVGRLLFCSGTFHVTLTESWQSNRNLLLKVRKFQNENWSRRIAQYMNEKFCRKYSGQNFSNGFVLSFGNVYFHSETSWPLNANIVAGKLVTVAMSKSGQLTVASHILVPDLINSGFKHKVNRNH